MIRLDSVLPYALNDLCASRLQAWKALLVFVFMVEAKAKLGAE